MPAAARRLFAAPVFPEDEDKTIAAAMAHYGILFGLVANLVHLPMLLLAGDPLVRSLLLTSTVVAALALNHYFLRRGYVRSSSAVFIAIAWATLAGANYTAGGVEAPGFAIHVIFVICVGFIFGGRWAFLAAGVSSLLGLLFMVLAQRGLLPPAKLTNTPARHAILMSSTFFVVAAILSIMVNRLRTTIVAGRRELLMRRETERRLERHQTSLEETVRVRTETLAQTNDALQREVAVRRAAEDALRREKNFIARLMETSPVGIVVVDAEGGFTFANAAAEQVLRRPRAEIARLGCASPEWGFTDYQGRPLAAAELPFLKAIAAGVPVRNAPLAVQTPEGTRMLLSVNVAPFGEEQDRRRCVVTLEDVTERQRLEQEVFRAQKLESVGVLAGGIAHDFNNLLTGIMGNISLARLDAPPGSPIAETLEEAEKVSLQARDLTRQLLTFSRGGAPVKSPVAIAEAVTHAVQLALRGSNVRGVYTIAPDLWPVEADQGQITQVFHNLGINACQSLPTGGTVDVEAVNVHLGQDSGIPLPPGRYVRVTVADHGVGIPPNHLERIFDPFFTTKKEGTGLGLAVAYSIVKSHGGHIGAESVEGVGSTFTVHLPATRGVPLAAAVPTTVSTAGRGRVLVMDDEPSVRSVASRLLAAMGYEVHVAVGGEEALAAYRDAREAGQAFDAVILDLTVPGGMGGAETLRHLREMDPDVKAVVSSGYSEDPVMSSYREYGFCNVLAKPYRSSDLGRVMREVLGNGGDGAPASSRQPQ